MRIMVHRPAEMPAAETRESRIPPELSGQRSNLDMIVVDHVAAGFGVLTLGEAVADGPHAAADTIARFEDGDRRAHGGQIVGGGEPRETRTGDEDRRSRQ